MSSKKWLTNFIEEERLRLSKMTPNRIIDEVQKKDHRLYGSYLVTDSNSPFFRQVLKVEGAYTYQGVVVGVSLLHEEGNEAFCWNQITRNEPKNSAQ